MKLLLHTCCGPCFLGVWEDLAPKDFEVTNLFYNPNIQPEEEYVLRLENLKKAASQKSKYIIVDEYLPEEHLSAIKGLEDKFPDRCTNCYILRLSRAAQRAKSNGFDAFSTTLLVSPYQKHAELKRIGEEIAQKENIEFYYTDWRPYFREGQNIAREMEIYRQKYCGCIYSKQEAQK